MFLLCLLKIHLMHSENSLLFWLKREKYSLLFWLSIILFATLQSLITLRYNNYLIFENTFRNLHSQTSLFGAYPTFHGDTNHYGPIFSLLMWPFTLLPHGLGLLFWNLFNGLFLYGAIQTIAIEKRKLIYWIALPCLVASMLSEQFNPTAAALIILSFTLLDKKGGFWSAFCIVLGTFIKLYGIFGLAFIVFVKDKRKFSAYLLMWALVLFALPMLFSSPAYILSSYPEWYVSLVHKNETNILTRGISISVVGFFRDVFPSYSISNLFFLLSGLLVLGLPYLNFKAYTELKFKWYMLASALIFPVLFSTGSEDCTYIIAIVGVGIWYVLEKREWRHQLLLALVIIFSFNMPLWLFPRLSDRYPVLLSMLSLPYFVVWLSIIFEAIVLEPI